MMHESTPEKIYRCSCLSFRCKQTAKHCGSLVFLEQWTDHPKVQTSTSLDPIQQYLPMFFPKSVIKESPKKSMLDS